MFYEINQVDTQFRLFTTLSILNKSAFSDLKLDIPSLPIQENIVDILSAYDDLIENNTRRIAILEEMARRIYQEWFVHFRFPGHEKVRMADSELGKIPEGWLKDFHDVVDYKEGPGLRKWQYRDSGVPFLNIRTLVNNDIDFTKVKYVDEEEAFGRYSHFLLEPNDHVVSSSGTLGRIVTIQDFHLPLMLNTSIIRMRPREGRIGVWHLKHFMQSDQFQNQIKAHAIGAAQLNYGPSHLKKMWILAPSSKLMVAYEDFVSPMEEAIQLFVRKNANLRQTRDLLLPKLISGEIDVSEMPEPKEAAA